MCFFFDVITWHLSWWHFQDACVLGADGFVHEKNLARTTRWTFGFVWKLDSPNHFVTRETLQEMQILGREIHSVQSFLRKLFTSAIFIGLIFVLIFLQRWKQKLSRRWTQSDKIWQANVNSSRETAVCRSFRLRNSTLLSSACSPPQSSMTYTSDPHNVCKHGR